MTPKDEKKFKKFLSNRDLNVPMDDSWPWARKLIATVLFLPHFEMAMGVVILTEFICAIHGTNLKAAGERLPEGLVLVNWGVTVIYVLELLSKIYVMRQVFFAYSMAKFDVLVVASDMIVQFIGLWLDNQDDMPNVSVLRVFRLVRLLRALRLLTTFRELYVMLHSLAGAMKAIAWCSVMIFVMLMIWSIIAVELLHPLNLELSQTEAYNHNCERCPRAYETVFQAALTLFQQIIAGDSWGTLTMPMIEAHPWVVIIYMPAFATIGMGLVNLILSVIVDKANDARRSNEQDVLKLKLTVIRSIFSEMDDDGSGCVSLAEFKAGVEEYPEFQRALNLLDINMDDITAVFEMMDEDESGTVSAPEFCDNLLKMKNEPSYTVLLFIKHLMATLEAKIEMEIESLKLLVSSESAKEGSENIDPLSPNPPSVEGFRSENKLLREPKAGAALEGKRDLFGDRHLQTVRDEIHGLQARLDSSLGEQLRDVGRRVQEQTATLHQQQDVLSLLRVSSERNPLRPMPKADRLVGQPWAPGGGTCFAIDRVPPLETSTRG